MREEHQRDRECTREIETENARGCHSQGISRRTWSLAAFALLTQRSGRRRKQIARDLLRLLDTVHRVVERSREAVRKSECRGSDLRALDEACIVRAERRSRRAVQIPG